MASFAKAEFALSAVQEDGQSLKTHLISAWRQSGIKPELLVNQPNFPKDALKIWSKFNQLHNTRSAGGFGPSAITFQDIQAWQTVTRSSLEPWELKAILKLDKVFLSHIASLTKGN